LGGEKRKGEGQAGKRAEILSHLCIDWDY